MSEEINFVNLTPHEVNIYVNGDKNQIKIPPSGIIARVAVERKQVKSIRGIPVYYNKFGNIDGIPDPCNNVIYIVSTLVRQALTAQGFIRDDVVATDTSPESVIRDKEGRTKGIRALQYV